MSKQLLSVCKLKIRHTRYMFLFSQTMSKKVKLTIKLGMIDAGFVDILFTNNKVSFTLYFLNNTYILFQLKCYMHIPITIMKGHINI